MLRIIAICIIISGCSVLPQKKAEPFVAVSCIDTVPAKPDLVTDDQLVKMTPPEFVKALHIDRNRRIIYIGELEAIVAGCK
jgi:hypothetical protein